MFVLGLLGVLSPWLARGASGARWSTLAWLLDLAAHWQWLWLLLLGAGLLALRRGWQRALVAALALASVLWLPAASLAEGTAQDGLRLISANVHLGQHDAAPLVAWALAEQADVLVLIELSPGYAASLAQGLGPERLPHRHWLPRSDPFGLGIASRWPLRDLREERNAAGIPTLRAVVQRPAGAFELVALHPMPPLSPRWHAQLDTDLRGLRPASGLPALLAGDFNASPWSLGALGLAAGDWVRASSLQPTWPAAWPGIPIDAVWTHGAWMRQGARVGPDIGSDHRPVCVTLSLSDRR